MATQYVFIVAQLIFRLFFVIVKESVMQANCRSKKGFRVVFCHETKKPRNHETAQINLNHQRFVLGGDKNRLLPTLFFEAGEG